jgi:hypothetical protein
MRIALSPLPCSIGSIHKFIELLSKRRSQTTRTKYILTRLGCRVVVVFVFLVGAACFVTAIIIEESLQGIFIFGGIIFFLAELAMFLKERPPKNHE